MLYTYRRAAMEDLQDYLQLVKERIDWMNRVGIRQWNQTDYLGRYPESYFAHLIGQGEMYLLCAEDGRVCAAGALLRKDPRWQRNDPAIYVHHLVSAMDEPGAGATFLKYCEKQAALWGFGIVRLDCAADNPTLNAFYERHGYQAAGSVTEGKYSGILRYKEI